MSENAVLELFLLITIISAFLWGTFMLEMPWFVNVQIVEFQVLLSAMAMGWNRRMRPTRRGPTFNLLNPEG
jgi:membrane protein implicated in regulation of membrane protease activity